MIWEKAWISTMRWNEKAHVAYQFAMIRLPVSGVDRIHGLAETHANDC